MEEWSPSDWTGVATIALTVVTLFLAVSSAIQARVAAWQFRDAHRPRVRIDWILASTSSRDGRFHLHGILRETLGSPVTLHWAETSWEHEGQAVSTYPIQEHELDGPDFAATIASKMVKPPVAIVLYATVSISNANIPGTRETWRMRDVIQVQADGTINILLREKRRTLDHQSYYDRACNLFQKWSRTLERWKREMG